MHDQTCQHDPHADTRLPSRLGDITREAYIYFGAGSTVALQMAHPGVGQGVSSHSATLERPLQRLRNTMTYVYAVTLGTDDERHAVARMVNRAHRPVRGPGYSAFDPDLQLWVAATLYKGAVDLCQLFTGPLDDAVSERLYREAAVYGTTLQVDPAQWPRDRAAFEDYWQRSLASFRVDDPVRDYMQRVLHGGSAPWIARGLLPLQRFVTRGLLPPEIRAQFAMPWTPDDEQRWQRFRRLAPKLYWRLPGFLRHLPARLYLRDMRRRIAANAV